MTKLILPGQIPSLEEVEALIAPNVLNQQKGSWKREFVLDFDGVTADWMTPFYAFLSQTLGRNIKPLDCQLYLAGYQGNLILTPDEFNEMFLMFAKNLYGYGALKPYPNAIEELASVAKSELGIRTRLWTHSPGASEVSRFHDQPYNTNPAQGERLALIENWAKTKGLPVDIRRGDVEFMSGWKKPYQMARDWIPLIVEDHGPTCISALDDYGLAAILVTQPYNVNLSHKHLIRFGDPEHPENQDRTGLGELIVKVFKVLEKHKVLYGSDDHSDEGDAATETTRS
jgi:hypothetical protein